MKKRWLVTSMVFAFTLFGTNAAQALGICVDVGACNDYFFTLTQETADTYSMHGYEYGCSANDRLATGIVRQDGDIWYLGFTGSNLAFDFTQQVTWNGNINASTLLGSYDVQYTYLDGGTLTAHGASGSVAVTLCNDPADAPASLVGGADLSKP